MEKDLSKEVKYYNKNKQEWLKTYADKYVLIKDEKLIGAFDNIEDAFQKAVEQFGNSPVLIKKVTSKEEPEELPALTAGIINSSI